MGACRSGRRPLRIGTPPAFAGQAVRQCSAQPEALRFPCETAPPMKGVALVQHGSGQADAGYASACLPSAVNTTCQTCSGRTATAPTGPTQTALRTRPPIHRNIDLRSRVNALLTATLRLVMEPASKGQVPRQGVAPRPSVFLLTPYAPGRFKGPVGSPLFAPPLTLEASASRSRPHRIVCFRRRAILRRFVPHPRKMAKYAAARVRKSLTPAHEPAGPSRAAGGGIRLHGSGFHKRVARPSLSSARRKNSPTARSRLRRSVLAGRKRRASHRHRFGLKIPARPLSAPASPAVGGARPLLHWPASPY